MTLSQCRSGVIASTSVAVDPSAVNSNEQTHVHSQCSKAAQLCMK